VTLRRGQKEALTDENKRRSNRDDLLILSHLVYGDWDKGVNAFVRGIILIILKEEGKEMGGAVPKQGLPRLCLVLIKTSVIIRFVFIGTKSLEK